MDFMQAVIDGIEDREHQKFLVNEENHEAVFAMMEADGYRFACSPAGKDENGMWTVYFEPDPGRVKAYRM